MKTVPIAVAATAICCRRYVDNQAVDQVDAAEALEWRILNPLVS